MLIMQNGDVCVIIVHVKPSTYLRWMDFYPPKPRRVAGQSAPQSIPLPDIARDLPLKSVTSSSASRNDGKYSFDPTSMSYRTTGQAIVAEIELPQEVYDRSQDAGAGARSKTTREPGRSKSVAPTSHVDKNNHSAGYDLNSPHVNAAGDASRAAHPTKPPTGLRLVGKAAPIQLLARSMLEGIDREIDARIVRVDGGILDQPEFCDRLNDIMVAARHLVRTIGVSKVVEFIIHAHTRLVYNRYGHRVLDGYVLRCTADAPMEMLCEVDFGQHCVVAPVAEASVGATDEVVLASLANKLLAATMDRDVALGGAQKHRDVSQRAFYDEIHYNEKRDRETNGANAISASCKQQYGTEDSSVPVLTYNGEILFMQGFEQGVGPVYEILVQNHSYDAVMVLQKHLREQSWTVAECYRSLSYDNCMTHGARSCVELACAAAQAMDMQVMSIGDDDVHANHFRHARVKTFAPLTFIAPVFEHDDRGEVLMPTFMVYINTYGDYDLSRAITQESHGRIANRSVSFAYLDDAASSSDDHHHEYALECRGFPLLNSAVGSCVTMRQIVPTDSSFVHPYWLDATEECLQVAREETRVSMRSIHPSTFDHYCTDVTGYPTRGVFDSYNEELEPTLFAKPIRLDDRRTRTCRLVHRGYLQPHQFSRHHVPLASTFPHNVLLDVWSTAFPQASGSTVRFAADNACDVLVKYSGGISGLHMSVRILSELRFATDYLRVPAANAQFFIDVMSLARKFHEHCLVENRSPEDVFIQDVANNSFLARSDDTFRDAFLSRLAGGAVQCDMSGDLMLFVDIAWLRYCMRLFGDRL